MDDFFSDGWYSAEFETENFFIGKDNFKDLEIRESAVNSNFYFFFNTKTNSLIRGGFVLMETEKQIIYECRVTLIKKGNKFRPKIEFSKRDRNKKLIGSVSTNYKVRSRVELNKCMNNFWKLISYMQGLSNIDIPKSAFTFDPAVFEKYDARTLQNIDSLVNVKRLKNVLDTWEGNRGNNDEEYWLVLFQDNPWIISQLFACPFVIIGKKFYCGGKEDDDKGGVKGDLLFKNSLTANLAFVEIKTPQSELILSKYRGDEEGKENIIYSMSEYVTGGTIQVLNQRKVYKKTHREGKGKKLNNAKCVLVVGSIGNLDEDQKKSFELHRSGMKGVEIITFDELFERISSLLEFLKDE